MSEEQEDFIDVNEVEEVLDTGNDAEPMSEDEDDYVEDIENIEEIEDQDQDQEALEIDISNNSTTYFDKHEDSVFTVFSHPTLPLAVSGGGDDTLYLWTTHSVPPKFVQQIKGHKESIITGGFTSDGEFLITGDMAGKILVHQAHKMGQVWKLFGELEEVEEIVWITVHPSQPIFAFGAADGSVWIYQITPTLEQIMSGFSHQSETTGGIFTDATDLDSLHLVTISTDGSIVKWNGYTSQVEFKLSETDFKGQVLPWISLSLQNDQSNIIAVGSNEGTLAIINTNNGTVATSLRVVELQQDQEELDASIETISWSDTLPLLAIGLVSGSVLLFDTKTWRERHSIVLDDAVTKVQFINGTPFLVGSSMNGKIYKWDARTGSEVLVGVGHNMGILDFSVIENGDKLITAGDEGVSLIFSAIAPPSIAN